MYNPGVSRNDYASAASAMQSGIELGGYCELNVTTVSNYEPTALHFDNTWELSWVGTSDGRVMSQCGGSLCKYTSFRHHTSEPVVDLLTFDDKILSLTSSSVKLSLKRGLGLFNLTHPSMSKSRCMRFWKDGSLLVGGVEAGINQIDIGTEQLIRSGINNDDKNTVLFRGTSCKYICCGTTNGEIVLREPDTLKVAHVIEAYQGSSLSDFDVNGHTMMTSGHSKRGAGKFTLDPFIKLYDFRMMRYLTPISPGGIQPHFLRYVSTYTRKMAILSTCGQFVLIADNASVTSTTPIYQCNTSMNMSLINHVDVSETAQAIALTDTAGQLHLWSSNEAPMYNKQNRQPEFADSQPFSLKPVPIDDPNFYITSIPFPYNGVGDHHHHHHQKALLSDWNEEFCHPRSRLTLPIPQQVTNSMRLKHGVLQAPNNTSTRHLNQAPYRSHDLKLNDSRMMRGRKGGVLVNNNNENKSAASNIIPERYRKQALKYNKLGDEEHEIKKHNQTAFAGLDPNVQNAYCNCMLQVLYFIEPLRCKLQSHHNLDKEYDLAEELGSLFHMFDSAKGGMIEATNFLRAFRTLHEANALGLTQQFMENESANVPQLDRLIQNWNLFMLTQIESILSTEDNNTNNNNQIEGATTNNKVDDDDSTEVDAPQLIANRINAISFEMSRSSTRRKGESPTAQPSIVERLFGTELEVTKKFRNGKVETSREKKFLFTLIYPPIDKQARVEDVGYVPFSEIVRSSINNTAPSKSWNEEERSFVPMNKTKKPRSVPEILVLNCNLHKEEHRRFFAIQNELYQRKIEAQLAQEGKSNPNLQRWKEYQQSRKPEELAQASWLPIYISMMIDANDKFHVHSTIDDKQEDPPLDDDSVFANYELHAVVSHIRDGENGNGLVSTINVSPTYHKRKEGVTHQQWYVFNEFKIKPIDSEEAVDFDLSWKSPCVLYYKREDMENRNQTELRFPIHSDILKPQASLAKGPKSHTCNSTHQVVPLQPDEIPPEGMLVALDAEFVTLNQEEAELHSDGTRSMTRPSQHLPARVTVVRGEGSLQEVPFIDDYIPTTEQIVDYLTKFSGIKPGDLDVTMSSKHLSAFKATYCKLRYLINRKCTFVGHGLKKDFKVINIVVKPEQVRDTVEIFHMPRKRYFSLRFLAWYFLDQKVQEGTHDSVEDSVTALRLYKKYLELSDNQSKEGRRKFGMVLLQLYTDGTNLKFKVPEDGSVSPFLHSSDATEST